MCQRDGTEVIEVIRRVIKIGRVPHPSFAFLGKEGGGFNFEETAENPIVSALRRSLRQPDPVAALPQSTSFPVPSASGNPQDHVAVTLPSVPGLPRSAA